jgi:predicted nucleotide-binding protein
MAMASQLPIRTTLEDVQKICNYFSKKPTGETADNARAALGDKTIYYKIHALRYWGILQDVEGGKLKATDDGRQIAKQNGSERKRAFANIINRVPPYKAIVERAIVREEESLTSNEVASHWHDHFKDDISTNGEKISDQVLAFFQVAEGAEIGKFIVGRKGAESRFQFNLGTANQILSLEDDGFVTESVYAHQSQDEQVEEQDSSTTFQEPPTPPSPKGKAIFIGHGKNKKPLEQLKVILDQFKVKYKVVMDEPNLGRPISEKVRAAFDECNCAILIFTADEEFTNSKGEIVWRPSENVVYELGAASYLYAEKVVILKEDDVKFPSNFSGIAHIPFEKDKLDSKAMDVLKELVGFDILKFTT